MITFMRKVLRVIGAVAAIAALVFGAWRYWVLSRELTAIKTDPAKLQELTLAGDKQIIGYLKEFMLLPGDEEPTIGLVSNVDELRGQPFFAAAKAGDRLIVYAKAKKAILYRPSIRKVIEVSPLLLATPTPSAPSSQASGASGAIIRELLGGRTATGSGQASPGGILSP